MSIQSLLIARVLGDNKRLGQLSLREWEFLIESLRENASLARFSYRIKNSDQDDGIPKQVFPHLKSELVRAKRQKQQALYESLLIDKHLGEVGVKPVFLKGAAYSISDSPVGDGRLYGDIDVLVEKHEIDVSKQALLDRGWFPQTLSDYDEMYYREWAHEIPPLTHLKRGTVVDLHHNLVPPISGRAPLASDFKTDLEETRDGLLVFSPAAQTLHSAVHLFLNEDFTHGFRDLTDLHILFTIHGEHTEYWKRLISLAQKSKFEAELKLAVRYCERLFNTPIPKKVSKEIHDFSIENIVLTDFIFNQVLLPRHPKTDNYWRPINEFFAYMRGHFLKMPLPILIKHLTIKSWKGVVESTLGKNFYDEENKINQ